MTYTPTDADVERAAQIFLNELDAKATKSVIEVERLFRIALTAHHAHLAEQGWQMVRWESAIRNWSQKGNSLGDVARERQRQIEVEGWTAEHDDRHMPGELAQAGACYALIDSVECISPPLSQAPVPRPAEEPIDDCWHIADMAAMMWPWEKKWLKPKGTRHNLVIAAALILAEIDRMDRPNASRKASRR